MELKKSQSKQGKRSQSKSYKKRNTQYSIPDPAQKSMEELILSIREKLQQILREV